MSARRLIYLKRTGLINPTTKALNPSRLAFHAIAMDDRRYCVMCKADH